MTLNDPHLLNLFLGLRQEVGLPLRLEDYQVLVEAWEAGFQPKNYLELRALCRRLWLKSPADKNRFDAYFEQYFEPYFEQFLKRRQPVTVSGAASVSGDLPNVVPRDRPQSSTSSAQTQATPQPRERYGADLQVGQAIPRRTVSSQRLPVGQYTLSDEYFRPLTRRQLQQGWRGLRHPVQEGVTDEWDIPATIQQISQQGIFLEPQWIPKRVNRTELLLLIDLSNSMAPFDLLAERLISTAQQAKERKDLQSFAVYYFRNYPNEKLYCDRALWRPISIEEFLVQAHPLHTVVLIFSDAGAARGGFNSVRWKTTQRFLNQVRPAVQQLAWLNPLPTERWQSGTASLIAQDAPMFALDLVGWRDLLKDLRGQGQSSQASRRHKADLTKGQDQALAPKPTFKLKHLKERLQQLVEVSPAPERYQQASQQILAFVERTPAALDLMCHAAFPLALTPDLFYFLRENFQQETDWVAIPDLLLSSLCRSVGYHLYEMDSRIRHLLLKLLVTDSRFGPARLRRLSDSLLFYVQHRLDGTTLRPKDIGERPEWIALAYTEPNALARQIAQALQRAYSDEPAEHIRLASLAATLAEPLAEAKFQPLLALSRGLGRLARGDQQGAAAVFRQIPLDMTAVEVGEIRLPIPGRAVAEVAFPPLQSFVFREATIAFETKPEKPSESELQPFSFPMVTVDARGQVVKRENRQALQFIESLWNGIELEMVAVPEGSSIMGSPTERPQVPPFFMGKYPVTQAQWRAVAVLPQVKRELTPNPSSFKDKEDRDRYPVESITWYDAVEFCDRLSQATGREYRLPSEAEWEYACRAGTNAPFGFGGNLTTDLANYNGKYTYGDGPEGENRARTTPVGSFPANAFGLYDMHGNVWEWCADHWRENYENTPSDKSIWSSSNEKASRVLRGGAWGNPPGGCRSAARIGVHPDFRSDDLGLRVVCAAART